MSYGYGSVIRKLDEHLNHIVLADHPCNIIVTVDLKDVVSEKIYSECKVARKDLEQQAEAWLEKVSKHERLIPLPYRIVIVFQIQKFETWIISDISGLSKSGYIVKPEIQLQNVDEQIINPMAWLKSNLIPDTSLKNPKHAKAIISQLNPNVMRRNSPSFDKFFRETTLCYKDWCSVCGITNESMIQISGFEIQ